MEKVTRMCLVDPKKGHLTLKFSVDEALVTGADFKIMDDTGKVKEQWKISAEDNSYSVHQIKSNPNDLSKMIMLWQVLCCSSNPRIYEGNVVIEVLQDGFPLQLIPSAVYTIKNVVPCSFNKPNSFSGSLMFIRKT